MNRIKRLFNEFKAFVSRGNVVDMAVGVIIATAFSAIVTALTNSILMPVINAAVGGKDGLTGLVTMLKTVYTEGRDAEGNVIQVVDMVNSIYIDWGTFITAVIDFLLIALVLFATLKIATTLKNTNKTILNGAKDTKLIRARAAEIRKTENISRRAAYAEAAKAIGEEEAARKKAEEEAKKQEPCKPTAEQLLTEIRDLLAESNALRGGENKS